MGKRRARRRKVIILLSGAAVFLFITRLLTNHGTLTFSRDAKPDVMCIYVDPAVRIDEFRPNSKSVNLERICPSEYGNFGDLLKWDINFNVERTFLYEPGDFVIDRKSNPSALKRFKGYMAKAGTPILGRYFSKIPKIIHFIWNDDIIPTIFVENLREFQRRHPTWQIHFWTIETGRNFIRTHEPGVLKTYDEYKDNMTKADALRYIVMNHFGGAYFDLDTKVVKPLDTLTASHECILGSEPIENAVVLLKRRSVLANAGFLCRPNHPYFGFLIDQLPYYGRLSAGPTYMSRCFNLYLEKLIDPKTVPNMNINFEIKIVPHEYFEYNVNKRINLDLGIMCEEIRPTVTKFTTECKKNMQLSLTPYCDNLYHQIPKDSRTKFEACLEWITSGEENRTPSKKTFVIHDHYGTTMHFKELVFKEQNVVSKVLPSVIEHY